MTKVAADHGVTGTALKKTCDRHMIPTPQRGHWAKLEHGKPVRQTPLPTLKDDKLAQVHVRGGPMVRQSANVREAKTKALNSIVEATLAPPKPNASSLALPACACSLIGLEEAPVLAATRRAIAKAKPDGQGFASGKGRGTVTFKLAPASMERALQALSRLLALGSAHGYRTQADETGLSLLVDELPIPFGIEEQPDKTLHQPTPDDLKRKADNERWGLSSTPWPKYDHAPSGRLAILIHANLYSGLRRTYSERKTRALEDMLTEILAGFAEHAASIRERRLAEAERARQWQKTEERRRREAAFEAREKRRMEFIDAIHAQLIERAKLATVLSHMQRVSEEDAQRVAPMIRWLQRRIGQIDSLIGPLFVDISAGFAEIDFEEPAADAEDVTYRYYNKPAALQFWVIDEAKGIATSRSPLQWAIDAGFAGVLDLDEIE